MQDANASIDPPVPLLVRPAENRTAQRWTIWLQQVAEGEDPCFGTDQRYLCRNSDCRFRAQCMTMRADWLR